MTSLDKLMAETSRVATIAKQTLDKIKIENDKFCSQPQNKGSATAQMRTNMYMVRTGPLLFLSFFFTPLAICFAALVAFMKCALFTHQRGLMGVFQ